MSAGVKIRCKKCGDVIQSMFRHDFVTCKCRAVSVDGGSSYLRLLGDIENVEIDRDGKWERIDWE